MPSNIEIKARVNDWTEMQRTAEQVADGPVQILEQLDTFFVCEKGRLKLRYLGPNHGELIAYDRPDAEHAKASRYFITATTEPDQLREVLSRALETFGTVRKRRALYLAGQTRIHLDEVDGLGQFMELEVVLRPEQTDEEGAEIARDLMGKLGIKHRDLVAGAYVDMMAHQATATVPHQS